ncbi:MAG TPA: hypothetical protein VFE05_14250 [Longimicrobiaceae bacterium]|nr:hypothetical protein [Longimicrobiaceae bacterium]
MDKLKAGYLAFGIAMLACALAVAYGLASGAVRTAGWAMTVGYLLVLALFLSLAWRNYRAFRGGPSAAGWESRSAKVVWWTCLAWVVGLVVWNSLSGRR